MSRISFFHLIQISVRFLGRKPEKTLIFIRYISIPIILLISISAIITSFNSNIIFLSSLAGEDSYLSLREKEDNLENSLVPLELEELIKNNDQNILAILPINQKDTSILVTEPYQGRNISFQSQIIGTNLSKLSLFWDNDLKEIKNINISSMQVNEVIIGEKLAEDLNILEENFPINLFIPIRDNNNFYLNLLIVSILKGNTIYTHSLLVNNKVFIGFESAFDTLDFVSLANIGMIDLRCDSILVLHLFNHPLVLIFVPDDVLEGADLFGLAVFDEVNNTGSANADPFEGLVALVSRLFCGAYSYASVVCGGWHGSN